ncbi:MAG: cofactor-independent phosphoglycerate mutase [Holophaga sp.]|nr:cofactor-independent phosphoglycerate mutase [Holophaga sp.]
MKYAIILPDGAADERLPQLGGRTPLEAARIPNMDWVARQGRLGQVVTIPDGYTPGTDVGTLVLMGYDPHTAYSGRAPMEATAQGLSTTPDQMIFRCNFVHLADGRMRDNTAGHIAQADALELIAALNAAQFPGERCDFHAGVSYRNLMFLGDAADMELDCAPPHDIADQLVERNWPTGRGQERVRAIMDQAHRLLAEHPVNQRRRARGELWATDIWLWGQGIQTPLASLQDRFGLKGVAITAVDIIRGIAVGMGMDLIEVPGATGYIDTDYEAKGRAAVKALDDYDLVVVHVEAPDESAHQGMAEEKMKSLERIDQAVVGPVLDALRARGDYRILVAPDHATLVRNRAHDATPPPFCYAGTGVGPGSGRPFTEAEAVATGVLLDPGHALLGQFLG